MDVEINEIRKEAMKMAWYMRGGISYEQVLHLSVSERKIIGVIVSENMETTQKTGLNFF